MNVKLRIEEIRPLITAPIEQTAKLVTPIAERARLVMPPPQVGAGYMQWSLPGSDWVSFAQADSETKSLVAEEYTKRKQKLQTALTGSNSVKNAILRIPSEEYLYFRKSGEDLEIGLVAWGYRFLEAPTVTDLDTYITRIHKQTVRIGFLWDGNVIPLFAFRLAGQPRETGEDGYLYVDNPLLVGDKYTVATMGGKEWVLCVEAEREEYLYDLTRTARVEVEVKKDGVPLQNAVCSMQFGDQSGDLVSDAAGHTEAIIALLIDPDGELLAEQPECIISCEGQTESQVPEADALLRYSFNLVSPKPEPKPVVVPEQKPKTEPVSESEVITIHLLDYAGSPLPDMPFTLMTKNGALSLKTDANGVCDVSRKLLVEKEKLKVKFTVTPEYQAAHDIHDPRKRKSKR